MRPLGTSTSVNVRSVNRPLYNVVDSARSHAADDLSVNHGGVAILVDADIALSPIDIADQPTTFDIVCARALCRLFRCDRRPAVQATLAAAADVL